MLNGILNNVTESEKNDAVENIIQHATPRQDFFLLLVLSVSMAAFGILLNNVVILVGSMLIAPLLYPIISLSLGVIVADEKLIGRSFYTIFKSIGLSLAASFVISFLFSNRINGTVLKSYAFNENEPSPLMYLLVAAIAGFAAAFAVVKPRLNETLPGVAISVSLVPPLAAAGIALSLFDWAVFSSALLLFLGNIIGIVFSAMIVFSLLKFSVKKTITKEVIKEEDKVIKKEEELNIKK